jgi:wobble nucleotide-excising tRNase
MISSDLANAKEELVQGLVNFVKLDIVPKKEYDQIKEQVTKLSSENEKNRTEKEKLQEQIQPLAKEIESRDYAVEILSKSLFPINQPLIGNWIIQCPRCKTETIFVSKTEDSKSLLQKGYISFKCGPCGQKTDLTLYDLYTNAVKQGYFSIKI